MAGMSRSATVMIAFVMNKHKMSFIDAKQLVQSKRPVVSPNSGFQIQLNIYENMKYSLDPNNRAFRRHLIDWIFKKEDTMDNFFVRRHYCSGLTRVNFGQNYKCLKCGQTLFKEIHIITNNSNETKGVKKSVKTCEYILI